MKLITRLKLLITATISLFLVIICLHVLVKTKADILARQEGLVHDLNFEIFESNQLWDEYFIYRTERPKVEWRALDKKISEQLKEMSALFIDTSERNDTEELVRQYVAISTLFNQLLAHDLAFSVSDSKHKTREMIISRMMEGSHRLYQKCVTLSAVIENKAEKHIAFYNLFNIISFGLLGLMVILYSKLMIQSVTKPLSNLKEGIRIIADGNLDHRLRVASSDEIGELAGDFNRMTERLAEITVSRNELSESEKKFSKAFKTSPYAITITRAEDGKFVEINDAFTTITGYSRAEASAGTSTGLKLWVSEKDRLGVVADLRAGLTVARQEFLFRTKSGKVITGLFSAQAIRLNKKSCILSSIDDISERKKAEKELQSKNAELERFAYTVSHDLKSPLITIQYFTGQILQDLRAGRHDNALQDLWKVTAAASKMTDLLNDLLELSRIGRMMNTSTQIDMGVLVEGVRAQLAGSISQRRIEVVVQPGLPSVFGDSLRIAEVVQNLVENAIKYMGDQAVPRIEIGARQDGNETVFFVRDNGKGVEPRYTESIFGLFNKLDAKSEGTGIGLALVKRIVDLHGGRVWVESEGVGKGSTFCFSVGS